MLKAALINNSSTVLRTVFRMQVDFVWVPVWVCVSASLRLLWVCLVWVMSSPGGCECDICPMFSQRHKRGFHHLNAGPRGDNWESVSLCVCVLIRGSTKALSVPRYKEKELWWNPLLYLCSRTVWSALDTKQINYYYCFFFHSQNIGPINATWIVFVKKKTIFNVCCALIKRL